MRSEERRGSFASKHYINYSYKNTFSFELIKKSNKKIQDDLNCLESFL